MKILTLIYTIYSFDKEEIKNLNFTYRNLDKKNIDVIVACDNPKINEILERSIDQDIIFSPARRNKGKFQRVKDLVDNNNVNSKFIKVVDPDDIIIIKNLNTVIDKLKLIQGPLPIVKMNPSLEYRGNSNIESAEIINNSFDNFHFIREKRKINSMVNWTTIFPTENLVNNKIKALYQTKSSDILMSLTSNLHDVKIIELEDNFYLYNYKNGLSGANSSTEMYKQMLTFFKILEENDSINFTTSPNKFDFLWCAENLRNSGKPPDEIKKELKIIYKILIKIGKDGWATENGWNQEEVEKLLRQGRKKYEKRF